MVKAMPFCGWGCQDDDASMLVSTNLLEALRNKQTTRACLSG